jgi:hypothetical protein
MNPACQRRDRGLAVRERRRTYPEGVRSLPVEEIVDALVHLRLCRRQRRRTHRVAIAHRDNVDVVSSRELSQVPGCDPARAHEGDSQRLDVQPHCSRLDSPPSGHAAEVEPA